MRFWPEIVAIPPEDGRSAGEVAYPKLFPCFGVSAGKRRHHRHRRLGRYGGGARRGCSFSYAALPRVLRRSLCHNKRDDREPQTKGCRAQARYEKVSFSPKLKQPFHIRAPEARAISERKLARDATSNRRSATRVTLHLQHGAGDNVMRGPFTPTPRYRFVHVVSMQKYEQQRSLRLNRRCFGRHVQSCDVKAQAA